MRKEVTTMARGYAFRFYGRKPTEFSEGGAGGHLFTVQFHRVPDDSELAQIGGLYESRLSTGNARPSDKPWQWSDRFGAFQVGERWISSGAHIGAVTDFLMESHKVVPIVDVVYHNALNGVGSWDQWSLKQGPPDAGPDFGRSMFPAFDRPVDPNLPLPAPHTVFEESRRDDVRRRANAKVEDVLCAERKPGKVGLVRLPEPIEETVVAASWPPEVSEKFQIPEQQYQGDPSWMIRSPGDHMHPGFAQRPMASICNGGGHTVDFCWLNDDGVRIQPDWPRSDGPKFLGPLHPQSGAVALAMSKWDAFLVDLGTGAVTHVHHCDRFEDEEILDVFWTDGGTRCAVRTFKRLCVFDPSTLPMKTTAVAKMKSGYSCNCVAMDGKVLVTSDDGKNPRVSLLGYDKVRNAGSFKAKFDRAFETEGRLILAVGRGADAVHYEVTHIDEIYEKFVAPLRRKAERKPNGKTSPAKRTSARAPKPRAGLRPTPVETEAVPRALELDVIERLQLEDTHGKRPKNPPKAEHRVSADGRVEVGFVRDGTPAYEKLTLNAVTVAIEGTTHTLDVTDRRFTSVDIAPDGSMLYITALDGLYHCPITPAGPGEIQAFHEPSEVLYNVVALRGGQVMVKAWKHLLLLGPDEDDGYLETVHKLPLQDTYTMVPIRDLNLVMTLGKDPKKKVWFGGVLKGKIKTLGTIKDHDYTRCVVKGKRVWIGAAKSKSWEGEGLEATAAAKNLEQ